MLLVDDDPVILDIMATGLAVAGYRVDACSEAGGALRRYQRSTPDVAVLDVGLPDMPGTELARELLRTEYRPIIILSNHNDLEIVEQAISSGVVGYLVKPLSVEQLIPSLETSLSRDRQRREQIASHVGGGAVSGAQLAGVMDRFPFALLIVDAGHHPIYRNACARRLLEEGVLSIDPAGRLRSRADTGHFVPLIEHGLGKSAPARSGAALLEDGPGRRLHACAAPLAGAAEGDEHLAAVIVFDSEKGRAYTFEALRALYGLTRKETDLVNGLLRGQSLEDYCAASFVTANTARTHLKSVYRKTDTNRQAEVVRLFASMFMPQGP